MRTLLALMPSRAPFPAASVLQEIDGDLGTVVWLSLRAVDLWTEAEPGDRADLFSPAAEGARTARIASLGALDPLLSNALRVLAGILGGSADGRAVAEACAELARWADAGGWPHTGFEAAARAALAAPAASKHALLAGRMAQRVPDYARGAAWTGRAIRLARRAGDGVGAANAMLARAQIHMLRGERVPAEAVLRETLRVARRHGAWEVKPRVYHNLFCIQCTDGDARTAASYALMAAEGYGLHHPMLKALAHDVAFFLAWQGRGADALPLMEALAPRMGPFHLRLIAFSGLARMAGSIGERTRFSDAWTIVWRMLDERISEVRASESLVNLAIGAAGLGDAVRVELAAREALRIATPRQEWREADAAQTMLACLAEGRLPGPPEPAAGTDEDLKDALAAAELLLEQLRQTPVVRSSMSAV